MLTIESRPCCIDELFFFPGLRDWLKSLRLHKYTRILLELSYDQLMELTDEELERRGVTLGARGKILKNVGFMKDRHAIINELSLNLDVSTYAHGSSYILGSAAQTF